MSSETLILPTESGQDLHIPSVLPIVPLEGVVAFPHMLFPLVVSEPNLLRLADEALAGTKLIGLFSVRPVVEEQGPLGSVDATGKRPTPGSRGSR